MNHAVKACKGRMPKALITMSIKLLLREDVSTALDRHCKLHASLGEGPNRGERVNIGLMYLAGERDHGGFVVVRFDIQRAVKISELAVV
jgi:hypothetical protein